jgi:hypothetical protein
MYSPRDTWTKYKRKNVQEAYNLICDNEHIRLDSVTSNTIESSIDTSDYDLQVKKI